MTQGKGEGKKDQDKSGRIKVGEVTASGGLTRQSVKGTMEAQLQKLVSCFPTIGPKAQVTIKLVIDANGAIKNASVLSKEIKDKTILDCLQRAVKGLRFDASSAGRTTEATVAIAIGG